MRVAQMQAASQSALFLLSANLISTVLVILLCAPFVPLWQLASWGAATSALALAITFQRLKPRFRDAVDISVRDIGHTLFGAVGLAAAWLVPSLFFLHDRDPSVAIGIWATLATLLTATTITMAALPLATLTFVAMVGGANAVSAALHGHLAHCIAITIFTALLLVATIQRARMLLLLRSNELTIAERDATVSLLLRETEENAADWLWEIDPQRRIIRANPRFAISLGVESKAIEGMPFLQVLAGSTWESGLFSSGLRELADRLIGREAFHDILIPVQVNGEERWWQVSATPRFNEAGGFAGFRGVGSDVTDARNSADKIARMARFDTLTGLPNRLLVNETLARAMNDAEARGTRCAFMMIDLDRFKAVNDTLGHPAGDRLLARVAERLKALITSNEMVGRLGGDEFAVVIRNANDSARTQALAQQIIEALSEPYNIDTHILFIGCSIGVAATPIDGRTAETLIRSADLALYRSKDMGGGVYNSYDPKLYMAAEERRLLEVAMRSAVANGEMHLCYQPVVSTGTGDLLGFEALLRWVHPEFGEIAPDKFIPLAEEARLLSGIGEWVLKTACAEAAQHWDPQLCVAVNVSPGQLHTPEFVSTVKRVLAATGLNASRLEIEVTESVFMQEGTVAVRMLEEIIALGAHLSLDDFGRGYSSLGYLTHTRFRSIKIDRSFVQGAAQGSKEAIAIIRAVVAMADSLGMATTAEGVETEAEYHMVQRLGCSKIQGFYFGRPQTADAVRKMIRSRRHQANVNV